MARPKKEKAQADAPQTGALQLDEAEVVEKMIDFNTRDSDRASDAGADRSEIGKFLDQTGINKRVFSISRGVLRMKKSTDQQDWLRSMEAMLPILRGQINKQTAMQFDPPAEAQAAAKDEGKPNLRVVKGKKSGHADLDAESDAFNKAAAETLGDEPTPFDGGDE